MGQNPALRRMLVRFLLLLLLPTAAMAERRTALVIGNAAYEPGPLRNPVNDATDMAAALRQLGFEVSLLRDADLRAMQEAIDTLSRQLRQGGAGLFYFAGHGVQVGGENYLIPIRARIDREQDVQYEAVPVGRVLGSLEDANNQLNVIILDACRDNSYARSWRSNQRGLATVQAARGALIAFATAPGGTANDGGGRNGLYTSQLLQYLTTPGLSVEYLFKKVRAGVVEATKGKQVPWEASSLIGDFFFTLPVQVAPAPPGPDPEATMWALVEQSTHAEDITAFLNAYPNGRFAPTARLKLQQLQRLAEQQRTEDQRLAEQERQRRERAEAEVRQRAEAQRLDEEQHLREEQLQAEQERLRQEREKLQAGGSPPGTQVAVGVYPQPPVAPKTLRNSIDMEFVLIQAGTFQMGSNDGDSDEKPVHTVRISRPFYLGKYEVTQAQWEAVMGNNPSLFKGDPNRPVENVSWDDVQKFIRRLHARDGGMDYRLPTEAEWEYAARAGSTTAYSFGDDARQLGQSAWHDDNSGGTTHPVGRLQPNAWGLYDMHGNVWEWVQDWKGPYPSDTITDPAGPSSGLLRVSRGGGWLTTARYCRSAYRGSGIPALRYIYLGFRLLREVP